MNSNRLKLLRTDSEWVENELLHNGLELGNIPNVFRTPIQMYSEKKRRKRRRRRRRGHTSNGLGEKKAPSEWTPPSRNHSESARTRSLRIYSERVEHAQNTLTNRSESPQNLLKPLKTHSPQPENTQNCHKNNSTTARVQEQQFTPKWDTQKERTTSGTTQNGLTASEKHSKCTEIRQKMFLECVHTTQNEPEMPEIRTQKKHRIVSVPLRMERKNIGTIQNVLRTL
jgi:hypothetical protein